MRWRLAGNLLSNFQSITQSGRFPALFHHCFAFDLVPRYIHQYVLAQAKCLLFRLLIFHIFPDNAVHPAAGIEFECGGGGKIICFYITARSDNTVSLH